eukprot:gene4871-34189_t
MADFNTLDNDGIESFGFDNSDAVVDGTITPALSESEHMGFENFDVVPEAVLKGGGEGKPPFTVAERIKFGIDIAKGMAHLAAASFVHRDLASRNVLVDALLNCKVADFGLAQIADALSGTGANEDSDGSGDEEDLALATAESDDDAAKLERDRKREEFKQNRAAERAGKTNAAASTVSAGDEIITIEADTQPAKNQLRRRISTRRSVKGAGGKFANNQAHAASKPSRMPSATAASKPSRMPSATISSPSMATHPPSTSSKQSKLEDRLEALEEAGRTSKDALSRVLLKQGHNQLNLAGNFGSDCFNSVIDEATGLLTMFTVYKPTSPDKLFLAAGVVYGVNVFIRFCIGINALFFPPEGSQLTRDDESGRILWKTWMRVFGGIILIMIEPVSGIRLLNSAFEPEPALTKKQLAALDEAKQNAVDVEAETEAKMIRANRSAAGKEQLAVLEMEIALLKKEAPLTEAESDAKVRNAAVLVQHRLFALERARMKGTETVEMVMAVFEDIPEIGISLSFLAEGGLESASQSDISLFVTSLGVSLFHAMKCFWSFWKLRKTISDAKLADATKLETHKSYFAFPEIQMEEERTSEDDRLAQQRRELEPLRRKLAKARRDLEVSQLRARGGTKFQDVLKLPECTTVLDQHLAEEIKVVKHARDFALARAKADEEYSKKLIALNTKFGKIKASEHDEESPIWKLWEQAWSTSDDYAARLADKSGDAQQSVQDQLTPLVDMKVAGRTNFVAMRKRIDGALATSQKELDDKEKKYM